MANLILNAESAPQRSWGASAVLGVPPTRGLAWFPPLALCIKTSPPKLGDLGGFTKTRCSKFIFQYKQQPQ
ncbi:MAG: hypothetical protein F6K55_30670 [Moorea sp. SIO4A3]|nr:hypothetical protein [Moorena sp. SIO4A3]